MWRDEARLVDMLLAAGNAQAFVAGMTPGEFTTDIKTQHAVVRALEIVGEAARTVPEEIRSTHPEIAWADLVGMRNRLVHEYFRVRLDVVWDVVVDEIPPLIEQLRAIVPPEGSDG